MPYADDGGQFSLKTYISSAGGFNFPSFPRRSSTRQLSRIYRNRVCRYLHIGSDFSWTKCLSCQVVPPATSSFRLCRCSFYEALSTGLRKQKRWLTSIFDFSLLAISKSPSRIPLATRFHNFLVSKSPISPEGSPPIAVTSSLGPVTLWNSKPDLDPLENLLVACQVPSITWLPEAPPVPGAGFNVALKECDLPEK